MRTASAASVWGPGLAVLYTELDRLDEARAEFERLAARDFDDLPRDGRWATCLAYLAEVCAALEDARRAAMLYRLLLPYGDRALVLGGGFVCSGASGRHLGMLAATMSNWSASERHFEEALAMNTRIGALLPLAHSQHDYAAMLLARGDPGARERAKALVQSCLSSARKMGAHALEERAPPDCRSWRRLRATSAGEDGLTPREVEVLRLIAIGRTNADIATPGHQPQYGRDARPQHPRQNRLLQPHGSRRARNAARIDDWRRSLRIASQGALPIRTGVASHHL